MATAGGGYEHHQQMHPTYSPHSQQTTIHRVQQLQQERCGYQERQQELLREVSRLCSLLFITLFLLSIGSYRSVVFRRVPFHFIPLRSIPTDAPMLR